MSSNLRDFKNGTALAIGSLGFLHRRGLYMTKFKLMAAVLSASSALAVAPANAQQVYIAPAPAIAWSCNIKAQVAGLDFAFGVRITDLWGYGEIACISADGRPFHSNIQMKMGSIGAGPHFAFPTGAKTCLNVADGNIGVTDPRAMFGEFRIAANVTGQLGRDQGSVGLGVQATRHGGFSGQLQLGANCGSSDGIGASLNVGTMLIMTPRQADAYRANRGMRPLPPRVVAPAEQLQPPNVLPPARMPAPAAPVRAPREQSGPQVAPPPPPPPPAAAKDNNPPPPPPPPPPAPAQQYDQETPAQR
jgi:hypothetical protein